MHKKILAVVLSLSLLSACCVPVSANESSTVSADPVSSEDNFSNYRPENEASVASGMDEALLSGSASGEVSAASESGDTSSYLNALSIPSSYNMEDSNTVPSVKNQNPYGNCWAFATFTSAESNLMMNSSLFQQEEPNFSEMQLAYYNFCRSASSQPSGCEDDLVTPVSAYSSVSKVLNIGSNFSESTMSLARWVGAVDETDAPQSSASAYTFNDSLMAYNDNSYVLENADYISLTDIASVKNEIMNKGAMAIGIGLYSNYINSSNHSYYCSSSYASQNHAVTIIGWDDSYAKTNFSTQPSSNGAWLCRNSWGASSIYNDTKGDFWVSYEDKSILRSSSHLAVNYQFVSAEDAYENIYQHDGGMDTDTYSAGNEIYMANVFTASSNQEIKAVSFLSKSYADQYEISVVTGVTSSPSSGSAVSSSVTSGTIGCAGYHTIPLKDTVYVGSGEKFAVIVKITNSSGAYLSYEKASNYSGYYTASVSASAGESYYSTDGSSWLDASSEFGGNLRVKAFSDNVSSSVSISRIYGDTRYETAEQIAERAFPNGSDEAVLVSGQNFPDALSASGYAGAKKCPILITENGSLSDASRRLIANLHISKITIIGGTSAVSSKVQSEVEAMSVPVERIYGNDRFETAEKVYEKGLENGLYSSTDVCVVASGQKAADALSMSPWTYYYHYPIFLADSKGNLDSTSLTYAGKFSKVYLIGQTGVVSSETESLLSGKADRIGGDNRYQTSVLIAEHFAPAASGYDHAAFANGEDGSFADALTGGMYSGSYPAPLLLIAGTGGTVFDFAKNVLKGSVSTLYIYGGSRAVTAESYNALKKCFI
jgi:C1A family cysteine protease/putative cell wall-binding protein